MKRKNIAQSLLATARGIRTLPNVLAYLITYGLFADAILTLSLFASHYLDVVGKLDDLEKKIAFLAAIGAGVGGAATACLLVRLFGNIRRTIGVLIALWALLLGALALASHPVLFMALIMFNGYSFGALFALSRAFYATLIPCEKQGEYFSIYTLFERAASVLGPLVWSGTAIVFASFGDDRYRFSMFSLALLIALSFFTFQYVRNPEEITKQES